MYGVGQPLAYLFAMGVGPGGAGQRQRRRRFGGVSYLTFMAPGAAGLGRA